MVTYDVIIKILGGPKVIGILRPEMTAYTRIEVGRKEKAILVPAVAVKRIKGKEVVFVDQDGTPSPRRVILGWLYEGKYEVLKGVKVGERVLVEGFDSLKLTNNPTMR